MITYDSLTKLLSRNAYLDQSKALHNAAIKTQSQLAMLSIDLDHFKKVNDKYGHGAGDYVLYKFGELVNSITNNKFICGRLGGEEFAITMPQTDYEQAKRFAETLREKLKNCIIIHDTHEIRVTTSIGIAVLDNNNPQSLEELLAESDNALYTAKRTGRDRSIVFDAAKIFNNNLQSSS